MELHASLSPSSNIRRPLIKRTTRPRTRRALILSKLSVIRSHQSAQPTAVYTQFLRDVRLASHKSVLSSVLHSSGLDRISLGELDGLVLLQQVLELYHSGIAAVDCMTS